MSADFIEGRVREIIAEQLGISEEDISSEATFAGDLGADALDVIELMMAFEEEFEVEIDDAEAEKLKCVRDVVDALSRRTQ